jgi:Family of unknown function (DUF6174)
MRSRRWLWRWAVGITTLLIACAALGTTITQATHRGRYLEAKARWDASAPAHYRITIATDPACRLETEVRAERMLRVVRQDRCMHPARTVTELFALIERGQLSEPCFFAGCACRVDVTTYARYDPTYGYPTEIRIRYDRAANWWKPGFWGYVLARGHLPGCALTSETGVVESIALVRVE